MRKLLVPCSYCKAEGIDHSNLEIKECPQCTSIGFLYDVTCDLCNGTGCPRCAMQGTLDEVQCPHCDMGYIEQYAKCPVCYGFKTMLPKWLTGKKE